MQIINITVTPEGHVHITSPLDIPTTLLALIEAQRAVVMQATGSQEKEAPTVEQETEK